MRKSHFAIATPMLLFAAWVCCIGWQCMFHIGSRCPRSMFAALAVSGVLVLLFHIVIITALFCLVQMVVLICRRQFDKFVFVRDVLLIVLPILALRFGSSPYEAFALGLKEYYSREVDLAVVQRWIESGEIGEAEIWLSDSNDADKLPASILQDLQKTSTFRVETGRTVSGKLYVMAWSGVFLIGNYGFVAGVNKDDLPYFEPEWRYEYRIDIDDKSFVWIREGR